MKVFISADMEGITPTVRWAECDAEKSIYSAYAEQMTREVVAACEGAINAGADEILVKDAHDSAANIDITKLPECVKIVRGWSGHPYSMVQGIDGTFDAAMFIGYHSAAGKEGNPLSHTMSGKPHYIKLNGEYASEFMIYSYAAAYEGVPTVFLSGDKMLCEEGMSMHPGLHTVAAKEGIGASTICVSPGKVLRLIKENAEKALNQDLKSLRIDLPESFLVEIRFGKHTDAYKMSYYPGMKKIDSNTLSYETKDYFEVLRMIEFVL